METYKNPVHIEFGEGSINFLARFIQGQKVLLLTSPSFEKRGVVERLKQEHPNIIQVINTVKPNPTLTDILAFRSSLNYDAFDKIIALGGGSVIDSAKALAVYNLPNEEMIVNIIREGFEEILCDFKPIIAIPTTAGTGSEVTMWGTIWDEENKLKYSISHANLYCEAAILDPQLHITLPLELTVQTGLDALSHSLEALWNKNSNVVSDSYAIVAAKSIIEVLPKLVSDLTNVDLRQELLLASYRAGLAFSNTQTALAHAMSYYMTLHKGIPHGIAASFTLPTIVKVAIQEDKIKYKLQQALGDNPQSILENLLLELNVAINGDAYSLSNDDWTNILESLSRTTRAGNSLVNSEQVILLLMGVDWK